MPSSHPSETDRTNNKRPLSHSHTLLIDCFVLLVQPPERDGAAEAPGGGAGTAQLIAPRPHHALRPGPVPPQTGHIRRGRGEGGELVLLAMFAVTLPMLPQLLVY